MPLKSETRDFIAGIDASTTPRDAYMATLAHVLDSARGLQNIWARAVANELVDMGESDPWLVGKYRQAREAVAIAQTLLDFERRARS